MKKTTICITIIALSSLTNAFINPGIIGGAAMVAMKASQYEHYNPIQSTSHLFNWAKYKPWTFNDCFGCTKPRVINSAARRK